MSSSPFSRRRAAPSKSSQPWLQICLLAALLLQPMVAEGMTETQKGRCHYKCAHEFGRKRTEGTGEESNVEGPLLNQTSYIYCKIGCYHFAGFEEINDEAFHKGRRFYDSMLREPNQKRELTSPLSSVQLLCVQSHAAMNVSAANLTLSLSPSPALSEDTFFDYFIEVVKVSPSKEAVIASSHYFSTRVEISLRLPTEEEEKESSLKFRVTVIDGEGQFGEAVDSELYKILEMRRAPETQLEIKLYRQVWHEERVGVQLKLSWSKDRIPLCSLLLNTISPQGAESQLRFTLNENRLVFVPRLLFDESYRFQVEAASSISDSLHLRTLPCTKLVHDYSLCPPQPVESLTWTWNSSTTAIVSWESDQMGPAVHFLLIIASLPRSDDANCHKAIAHRRSIQGVEMMKSALVTVPSSNCEYSAELVVVDARNRASRPVTVLSSAWSSRLGSIPYSTHIDAALVWSGVIGVSLLSLFGLLLLVRHRSGRVARKNLKQQHMQIMPSLWKQETEDRTGQRYIVNEPCNSSFSSCSQEIPRGVYRGGKWLECSPVTGKGPSTLRRAGGDDGYAVCELYEPGEEQLTASLASLPSAEHHLEGVPVYTPFYYEKENVLGRGRFGVVYRIRFSLTGAVAALKVFTDPSEVSRELSIARCVCLRSCHHPSLLVSLLAASATYEMELDGLFYELCSGGDLLSLLVKARQHLPQRVIKAKKNLVPALVSFAMQIAAALNELHQRGYVHRDVSARNALLMLPWSDALFSPPGQSVKLADIGLAVSSAEKEAQPRTLSLPWQAPEVRAGAHSDFRSDVWSLGCLLCEISSLGSPPWNGELPPERQEEVKEHLSRVSSGVQRIDNCLFAALRPMTHLCLRVDASLRPTPLEVFNGISSVSPSIESSIYYAHHSQYV